MNEIGDAFAAALRRMLDKRGITIEAAAAVLGVRRQSFHSYLQGKLPRRKTLNKAMHVWDLKLDLGRHSFTKGAFGTEREKPRLVPKANQLKLLELLDGVKEEDLHVETKRAGKVLHVDVKIQIPA